MKDAHTPLTEGEKPLLTLDVWEHAHYIDHRNARPKFLGGFWEIINWGSCKLKFKSMADQWLISIENEWKIRTKSANEEFNNNLYINALSIYQEVLIYANRLNENASHCEELEIPFVQVFIISCNNIAYTHEECGELKEAEKLLKRPIYFVNHLMSSSTLAQIERFHLASELKRTVLAYSLFCQRINIKIDSSVLIQTHS